jgi:hypothetical protein
MLSEGIHHLQRSGQFRRIKTLALASLEICEIFVAGNLKSDDILPFERDGILMDWKINCVFVLFCEKQKLKLSIHLSFPLRTNPDNL